MLTSWGKIGIKDEAGRRRGKGVDGMTDKQHKKESVVSVGRQLPDVLKGSIRWSLLKVRHLSQRKKAVLSFHIASETR